MYGQTLLIRFDKALEQKLILRMEMFCRKGANLSKIGRDNGSIPESIEKFVTGN